MTPYIVRTSDEAETKGPLPARIFTFLREHHNDRMIIEFDNHFSH